MPLLTPLDATDPRLEELTRFFATTLGFTPNSVLTMQRRPAIPLRQDSCRMAAAWQTRPCPGAD